MSARTARYPAWSCTAAFKATGSKSSSTVVARSASHEPVAPGAAAGIEVHSGAVDRGRWGVTSISSRPGSTGTTSAARRRRPCADTRLRPCRRSLHALCSLSSWRWPRAATSPRPCASSPAASGSSAPTWSTHSSRRGAHVRVIDALVDGHGGDRRNVDGARRRDPRWRRSATPSVARGRRRRRHRVQPRRSGQPPRVDARPAARSAPQHRHPRRVPRDPAPRQPGGAGRAHLDPPGLRPAAAHRRSTSCTRPARWMSTASPSWPASSSTSSTTRLTDADDQPAADQRLRPPPAADAATSSASCRCSSARRCSARRSRSSATARSAATACTSTTSSRRLLAATAPEAIGKVFNVGHVIDHSLAEIAALSIEAAGSPSGLRLVPWPDDHQRIDIGSFHTDGTPIAEALGWKATTTLDDGLRATAILLSWAPVVPVVDLSRRGQRFASTFAKSGRTIAASGSFLLGAELSAFEAEFAEWLGARGASPCPRAPAPSTRPRGRRDRPRRRGDRAGVHRRAHRLGGRRPRGVPAQPTSIQARLALDRAGLPAAVTARTQAVDRRPPLRLPAAAPATDLPIIEDAAQAHGALRDPGRSIADGVQLLPDEEPRRHRRRRCRRHRRSERSPTRAPSCACTG